jgi:hypothetical protein
MTADLKGAGRASSAAVETNAPYFMINQTDKHVEIGPGSAGERNAAIHDRWVTLAREGASSASELESWMERPAAGARSIDR